MLDLIETPEIRKHASRFAPGECLFNDGDPGDSVFILVSGELEVLKGDKVISTISGSGTIFGEVSFLLESPRTATVAARTAAEVISLPNERVAGIWGKFPDFAVELTRILARRLADTTDLAHGFREFCDRMPDSVIMTDPEGKIVSWNRAAEKLYGREWNEMRHRPLSDCHDDEASLNFFLDQINREQTVRERLLKVNHPGNPWCFASVSGTALRDSNDAIRNYILLARDASEQTMRTRKKHRLIILVPAICLALIFAVTMILSSQGEKPKETGQSTHLFLQRLKSDGLGLELALAVSAPGSADKVLRQYVAQRKPQATAITAVILRAADGRITACRESGDNRRCDSKNDPGFSRGEPPRDRYHLYYLSRGEKAQEVEIMRPIEAGAWLSFRLSPAILENKFGISPDDLKGLP